MSETTTGTPAAGAPAAPGAAAAPAATPTPAATPAAPAATPAPAAAPSGTLLGDAATPAPAESTAGDKPEGEAKPDAPIAPVEYTDFTLPEGITADAPLLATFKEQASKLGIPQEQAQALVTAVGEKMAADAKASAEAQWTTWNTLNETWQSEIKNDPVIGGAKFEATKITVARLFDDYVGHINTPERKALNEALLLTGAGNNPAIVRAIAKIAAAHTEGSFVSGSPARGPVDRAALMYPTMGRPNGAASGQQGP